MYEVFEEVFGEVYEEYGCSGWWEVFDSELFEVVTARIAERLGLTLEELDEVAEFAEWESEMYWDL